jgi:hypothetical protein
MDTEKEAALFLADPVGWAQRQKEQHVAAGALLSVRAALPAASVLHWPGPVLHLRIGHLRCLSVCLADWLVG